MSWKKILLEGDAVALSDTPPVDVDFGAASEGTGTLGSRDDHKHDVPEAIAADLANPDFTAEAVGTLNKFVRADHKHALTEGSLGDLQPVDGTAESLGTVDALLRADHIHALGPLVGDLDFAQSEIQKAVVEQLATPPGTPVQGQIFYDTSDDHIYVYVV